MSQEDWEQSLRTDYQVDPLPPPEWSVPKPPSMHLSSMEDDPVDKWRPAPQVTPDELLQQLTQFAQGTSQACSYHSQEFYFRHSQWIKESVHDDEAEQGHQYRKGPVHVDSEIVGPIITTVTHLQWELQVAKDGQQTVNDLAFEADVHRRQAEREVAKLKQELSKAEQATLKAQEIAQQNEYHETFVKLERPQTKNQGIPNRTDWALIESLVHQLNDAHQQLA